MNKPPAYDVYQQFADAYARHIDTKPHNAYYDRPAVLSLLPDIAGSRVLDAGCGPGAYAEQLVDRGATVTACDISERMLELTKQRLRSAVEKGQVEIKQIDLTQPLVALRAEEFDGVVAPLCLDYIEDWRALFREFHRVLKPGGIFVFSCGHPSFDAEYFKTAKYFEVESVECTWTGFGEEVQMPSYRRPLNDSIMSLLDAGFELERFLEPLPTAEFKRADPVRYERLMHRPSFLCMRGRKPAEAIAQSENSS